jgi:hypothetical protein
MKHQTNKILALIFFLLSVVPVYVTQAQSPQENPVQEVEKRKPAEDEKKAPRETGRDGRFIAYDNGTVLDTWTNLMWAARDNGTHITWAKANTYCENYRGAGYSDWRMPTLAELAGLYDWAKSYKPSCLEGEHKDSVSGVIEGFVHLTELIHLSCSLIWASDSNGAMVNCFGFDTRKTYWVHNNPHYALPVRSAK